MAVERIDLGRLIVRFCDDSLFGRFNRLVASHIKISERLPAWDRRWLSKRQRRELMDRSKRAAKPARPQTAASNRVPRRGACDHLPLYCAVPFAVQRQTTLAALRMRPEGAARGVLPLHTVPRSRGVRSHSGMLIDASRIGNVQSRTTSTILRRQLVYRG